MTHALASERSDRSVFETYGDEKDLPAAVSWSAIFGGAAGALALTFILLALGVGFGLISPSSSWDEKMTSPRYIALIWIIVMQWLSSALAGYLTGRLRTKWNGVHTHEVFFRDTAHGFLAWAVATILYSIIVLTTASSLFNTSVRVAAANQQTSGALTSDNYYIDELFRTDGASAPIDMATKAEATRLVAKGVKDGSLSPADKTYLIRIIGTPDAEIKIDSTITQLRESIDSVRKTASILSIFTGLSMLIGAFIACIAAALGGMQRDEPQPISR